MPTTKPRITITLSPKTYDAITTYADLRGRPKAGVVAELLEAVTGHLGVSISRLVEAKNAPDAVVLALARTIQQQTPPPPKPAPSQTPEEIEARRAADREWWARYTAKNP